MAATHEDRNAQLSPGVAIKAPCRVATTAAITLSGEQTIDGVACVTGDRVLVKNQTNSIANGIYGVSTGAWAREPDFDGNRDVVTGTFVFITSGATNAGAFYECTTAGTVVFGTSNITFAVGALGPIAIPISGSNVTFTQSGTPTAGSVSAKLQQIISVKDAPFNAVGDGVTDDTAAINAAMNAVGLAGGGIVFFPRGSYRLSSSIIQLLYSNVTLRGEGKGTILMTNETPSSSVAILGFNRATYKSQTVLAISAVVRGATSITFTTPANASTCAVGSAIYIKGGTIGAEDNCEVNVVTSINAGTGVVGLLYPTAKAYSAATLGALNVESLTLRNFRIEHMRINHQVVFMNYSQFIGVTLEDVDFFGDVAGGPPSSSGSYRNAIWRDVNVSTLNPAMPDGCYQIAAAVDVTLDHVRFESAGTSPLLNLSDGCAKIKILGGSEFGGAGPITFTNCSDVIFSKNIVSITKSDGNPSFISANGVQSDISITNNHMMFLGTTSLGVAISSSSNTTLKDNHIVGNASGQPVVAFAGSTANGCICSGNTITTTNAATPGHIQLTISGTGGHQMTISDNILIGNNVVGSNGINVVDSGLQAVGPTITGNQISGVNTGILVGNPTNEPGIVLENNTFSGLVGTAIPYNPSGNRTGTSATDTIVWTDRSFIANRAGTITLTLINAALVPANRPLTIRTIQAQTVVSASSNVVPLVGGAAGTAILAATAGKWAILQSDGTNYQIMAAN